MAQKNHPKRLRLGLSHEPYRTRWFSKNPQVYRYLLLEDMLIRKHLFSQLKGCTQIEISRYPKKAIQWRKGSIAYNQSKICVLVALPRRHSNVCKENVVSNVKTALRISNSIEISFKESTTLVEQIAQSIQAQLLKGNGRVKKILKQATSDIISSNPRIKRFRIECAGLTSRSLMASRETTSFRSIPKQQFSAPIQYIAFPIKTSVGILGVKIWVLE